MNEQENDVKEVSGKTDNTIEKDNEGCDDLYESSFQSTSGADDAIKLSCYSNAFTTNTESLLDCVINKDLFQKGIDSVSKTCGSIVALMSVGVSVKDALIYITERESAKSVIKNNILLAEKNNEITKAAIKAAMLEEKNKEI